jgi:hypothetical protein
MIESQAKAAKDGASEEAELNALVEALHELANDYAWAAQRAVTLDDEDTRRREAAQVRFVSILTASRTGYAPIGEAWLIAGRRMLDVHDAADMDAVHESRSRRRTSRDLHPVDPRGDRSAL